jgi:formimidoylglutamate deiminase
MKHGGSQIIEADLTWTGTRFETGVRVVVNREGAIDSVGAATEGGPSATHRLVRRALLPGMTSAHSHAFQHAMRASAEIIPKAKTSSTKNFWSWRETMYELVDKLDADAFFRITLHTFSEMRRAGITSVGEFHYLRHSQDSVDFAFDALVLRAAREAGIRIAFLSALYQTSTIGKPVVGAQQRFTSPDLEAFWRQIDALEPMLVQRTQTLGIAPHSVRAVDIKDVKQVCAEAAKRGMVVHMHVEEQPREIEECRSATGRTPMRLLLEAGVVGPKFTAIHCTHSVEDDLRDFGAAGASICLCPITEGVLSDGIADVTAMLRSGATLCLGTDANTRLCMNEEMRLAEYVQRVKHQCRGIVLDDTGDPATTLFNMATRNGARALGLNAGAIATGCVADFVALDLDHPSLAGWTDETLLSTFVFGCSAEPIAATCVGGEWMTHSST